jgi:hypothetical protein
MSAQAELLRTVAKANAVLRETQKALTQTEKARQWIAENRTQIAQVQKAQRIAAPAWRWPPRSARRNGHAHGAAHVYRRCERRTRLANSGGCTRKRRGH